MKLQVPAQMAGVTGPCPQCSASITAPQPSPAGAANGGAANITQSPQPVAPAPQQAPVQPVQQQIQQPVQQQAPQQPPAQAPQETPPSANPQPVQKNPAPRPESPKQQQEQNSPAEQEKAHQKPAQPAPAPAKPRARWMRVVFPLAFLIVAGALVLAVLQAVGIFNVWDYKNSQQELISTQPVTTTDDGNEPDIKDDQDNPAGGTDTGNPDQKTPPTPVIKSTPEEGEFPELQLPPASPDTSNNPGTSAGTPTPPVTPPASSGTTSSTPPSPSVPAPAPPSPPSPVSPPPTAPPAVTDNGDSSNPPSPPKAGFLANQNLNLFLDAKTLDERMGLMSKSKHTREQLMASCLAGPLKAVKSVRMVEMVPRAEDNMTQYLYFVSFEDPKEDRQRHRIVMQVVERPGIHPPRVHGDAFIEHYEKRFAKYAKHPNKDVTTFHCIAEARTADLAKDLPKELKKTMIRLVVKSHPHGAAAFNAYLNKNSPLMERIGTRKEFPYTEPRFCILSFRWNTTDPNHPYIELNDIVQQGWER